MRRSKIKRQAGFTLIEALVAMGVLSLLLGIAVYSFNTRSGKVDASAVAKIVSDLLVQSRSRAAAVDEPTGLVFPGTSTVYAQSYRRVSGRGLMAVEGQKDWSSEFPKVYLSWGAQDSEAFTSRLVYGSYDLSTMSGFESDDTVLLFTPNGEVLVRGLPFDGTYYHLRVGSEPSGGSTALTGLNQAWDIKVDTKGNILTERVPTFPPGGGASPITDNFPGPPGLPGASPEVLSVTPTVELVDTGVGYSLATRDESVQLVAEARSPSGLPLFIRWTSDGGQFTDDSEWVPMTYSADDNRWKSSISWSLPTTPDSTQTVSVEVRDRYNNTSANTALSRAVFDTTPRVNGRIFFVSRPDGSTQASIETINGDGSGRRALIENLPSGPAMAASPSGEFLAWVRDDNMNDDQVAVSDTEGNILQVVTLPNNLSYDVSWSEDSRRVIVCDENVDPTSVYSVNPTDGSFTTLITFPDELKRPKVSGDLTKIVYTKPSQDNVLFCYDRSGPGSESILYTSGGAFGGVGSFRISSGGNFVGFIDSQSWPSDSVVVATDGSSTVNLGPGSQPTISPDESTVVYISRDPSPQVVVTEIDGTVLYTFPSLNGGSATEKQHIFSPDSQHIVLQAGVWYDHRLMAIEVADGELFELLEDDDLNKFSPQVVSVRGGP